MSYNPVFIYTVRIFPLCFKSVQGMSSEISHQFKEKPFYAASLISQKSRLYNTLLYPLFLQTFQRPVFPPLLSAAILPNG